MPIDPSIAKAYRRGENLHLIAFNYWHASDSREEAVELIAEVLERIGDTGYSDEKFQSAMFVRSRGKWLDKNEVGSFTQEFIANEYEGLMDEVLKLVNSGAAEEE